MNIGDSTQREFNMNSLPGPLSNEQQSQSSLENKKPGIFNKESEGSPENAEEEQKLIQNQPKYDRGEEKEDQYACKGFEDEINEIDQIKSYKEKASQKVSNAVGFGPDDKRISEIIKNASLHIEKNYQFNDELNKENIFNNTPDLKEKTKSPQNPNKPLKKVLGATENNSKSLENEFNENIPFEANASPADIHQLTEPQSQYIDSDIEGLSAVKREEINLALKRKYNLWDDLLVSEKLGSGEFGEVYRVFDKTNRQFLAQKHQKSKNGEFNDRISRQEYQALLKLLEYNHPSLLRVVQLDYCQNTRFFALMEYGQGNLTKFVNYTKNEKKNWSKEDYLELYFQLCDQVEELRKILMCHRDIKPDNVIISDDGYFKLTDYGFAEILTQEGVQEMSIRGTPTFWAEEINKACKAGKSKCNIDPYKADLYSVKMTVNWVISETGNSSKIDQLLKENPHYLPQKKIKIYEDLKEIYKLHIFEELYKEFSLTEKYEKLHIFVEYCTFGQLGDWLQKKLKEPKDAQEAQLIRFLTAEVHQKNGYFPEAMRFYKKCERMSSALDDKQKAILYSAMGATEVLRASFDSLDSAEEYYKKSLSLLDKESSQAGEVYCSFGVIQSKRGKHKEALDYYAKAEKIYQNNDSKEDTMKLNRLYHEIAIEKEALGLFEEALKIRQKQIEGLKKIRGEKHPDVGGALNNLGMIYDQCNQVEEALECYNTAKEIYEKTLPDNHVNFAHLLLNIGALTSFLGKKQEALKLYEQSVKIFSEVDSKHIYIYATKINIAAMLLDLEDYAKARETLLESLKGYEENQPNDYYFIGVIKSNLGLICKKTNQLEQALQYYEQSIETLSKLSEKHPETVSAQRQIGSIYILQGRLDEALDILNKALNSFKDMYSGPHTDIGTCLYSIGEVYQKKQQKKVAKEYYQKSLEIMVEVLGPDHSEVKDVREALNSLYCGDKV